MLLFEHEKVLQSYKVPPVRVSVNTFSELPETPPL